jgi:hypothetical protein
MRKLAAWLIATIAATLIGTAALAATQGRKNHWIMRGHHRWLVVRHLIHRDMAHFAKCPAGSNSANYCTPPVFNSIYFTFGSKSTASVPVTTKAASTLLVAFVQSDGPPSGGQSSTVSGGGLTWTEAAGENRALGDAEVWYAMAPNPISKQTISATASITGYDEVLTVATFTNAPGIASSTTCHSTGGAPTCTLTTTQPDGWVWASANDWGGSSKRSVPSGQNAWVQILDGTAKKTFWVQSKNNPTSGAGTSVTINDTAPTGDPFNLVLVEIV